MENGVAAAEDRLAIEDSGRAVDVIAGLINPVGFSGRGINAVEAVIVAANDDRELAVPAEVIRSSENFIACHILPGGLACLHVQGVKRAVVCADEHFAINDERGRFDLLASS